LSDRQFRYDLNNGISEEEHQYLKQQAQQHRWTCEQLMCSNESIIVKDHRYSDEGEDDQKINTIDDLNIGVLEVEKEGHLHQNDLVAVVSFRGNILSIDQRHWIAVIKKLER